MLFALLRLLISSEASYCNCLRQPGPELCILLRTLLLYSLNVFAIFLCFRKVVFPVMSHHIFQIFVGLFIFIALILGHASLVIGDKQGIPLLDNLVVQLYSLLIVATTVSCLSLTIKGVVMVSLFQLQIIFRYCNWNHQLHTPIHIVDIIIRFANFSRSGTVQIRYRGQIFTTIYYMDFLSCLGDSIGINRYCGGYKSQ